MEDEERLVLVIDRACGDDTVERTVYSHKIVNPK